MSRDEYRRFDIGDNLAITIVILAIIIGVVLAVKL